MHIFNKDTGKLEEVSDKKSLFEVWVNRPRREKRESRVDGDDEFWLRLWQGAFYVIATVVVSITVYNVLTEKFAQSLEIERSKNNYCQVSVLGVGQPVWQKCK